MATDWGRAGPEPSLEDVMADPMVQLVMRRDGLTPDDVNAVIEAVQRRHRGRSNPAPRGSSMVLIPGAEMGGSTLWKPPDLG